MDKIIICDETSGSLDDENKQIVMDLLVELNVNHDQSLFKYAKRIINI